MARRALARDCCVLPIERKSGDARVIEGSLIERTQLAFGTCMLDMACDAVAFDVPMDSGSPRNSVGDRLVARQALLRRDALAALVALLAIRDALERCMWSREASR